jgi:hypothetical protein
VGQRSVNKKSINPHFYYNEVIEFCLKEELAEPRVEVHRVFTKFWYVPSIVDDKPILKKVICLLSTGIIIVEKTTDIEYYFAFTEFLKENIKNTNESILYSLVISLNNCLRRLKPLTDQSLRILLIELWKRVFGGEDKVGKGFLYIA